MNIAFLVMFCNKADQTIESLSDLLGFKIPIYLLNNGSDKESTQILEEWLKSVKGIEYFKSNENLGVSKGRNYLIKKADTDWLFFLDNDITIPDKNFFGKLRRIMSENKDTKIFTPRLYNVHLKKKESFYNFTIEGDKVGYTQQEKGRINKISGGACIIHKSVFKNNLYNEDFFVGFEDYEFSLRAIKNGKPLDCLCMPQLEVWHDHRQVVRKEDNKYLQVRYGEKIKQSYELIKKLHGLELPDNGVNWSKNEIKRMQVEVQDQLPKREGVTRILLYANDQSKIGGIETFNKNFCKRMSKWYDITFVIKAGHYESLKAISQYAEVIFDKGQEFETDICIYAQTWGDRSKRIKAKRYIQMIHGDYGWLLKNENFKYKKLNNEIEHIACGKYAGGKFTEVTGEECKTIYNLLDPDRKPQRLLKLITVSRIARHKGFEKMSKFIEQLKKENIPFLWQVWGDSTMPEYEKKIKSDLSKYQEVVFMGATEDATNYVADADYLVLFSESEAFPYSTYEALQVGTPCIVTDFPSATDQIQDGKNGYIFKMDLSDLDVNKIYNNIPKFEFKELGSEEDWKDYIGGSKDSEPLKPRETKWKSIKLRVKRNYTDTVMGKRMKVGEELEVDKQRADTLISHGVVEVTN